MKLPEYVLPTKEEVQSETIRLFLNRDYAVLENLAVNNSRERLRAADGSWVLEHEVNAFNVSALKFHQTEMEDRFAEWMKDQPQSQFRAACDARYWRMAANASQSHEELVANFSRRDKAFESIAGAVVGAPLAAEKLRRLPGRAIDRAKAEEIYAAGVANMPGYAPLLEAYAYWLYYGVSRTEMGPWLGRECDKTGGVEGDELYVRVAFSGSRASGNWIAQRGLDWPRMQRGFWSLHRRWPGATDALDQLANAAVVCKDPAVLREALQRSKTPVRSVWSDNYGAYLRARRLAGLEKPSDLKPVTEVTPDRKQRLYRAAYSPDGTTLAIGGAKGELSLWSLPDLKLLWSDTNPHWISALTYSPDGRWLAAGGGNFHDQTKGGNVRVWDMTTHTVAVTLDDLPEMMNAAAFSPSGNVLWVGGGRDHGQLAVWRVGDPRVTLFPREDVPRASIQDLVADDRGVYLAAWRDL